MKKWILAWSLILGPCLVAHAEQWMEMDNQAGGRILFLRSECGLGSRESGGLLVISTTPSGDSLRGCWFFFAGMVHVVWEDGKTSSFEPKNLRYRESR